jgi:hypothetical protein
MVGMCRCIQTDDGVTWVHIDDYRELQKRYEAEVGFESNEDIIARVGEDEIPEHDGCSGCKYEHEPAESTYCTGCTQNAIDKYTIATTADKVRQLCDEKFLEFLADSTAGKITDVEEWLREKG